ncbi:hypothetical protein SAMN04488691_1011119 [Haloferax larsenii]|uniref:Uncharacterized protein n=1 Tax=Haloferax larsenii TaxID=302484 RepID=A0A1H7J6T6_HALLR|nr:hypothetical protein SAMN04488691_1011119 [Haloferax larsenii]
MFSTTPRGRLAAALVILVLAVATPGFASTAAAQPAENSTVTNETTTNGTDARSVVYQFDSGAELVDVRFDDGTAYVTLTVRQGNPPDTLAVGEGGLEESGSFNFQTVRVIPGEEVTVEIPVDSPAVTVTTSSDGYYYSEESGAVNVLERTPTAEIVQLAAVAGVIGSVLALGIVVGLLKRRHSNSYEELFSDERVRIETDPVEGVWEALKRSFVGIRQSKLKLGTAALLFIYVVAMAVGSAPTPGAIWDGLGDGQRVLVVASLGASLLAVTPVYVLVKRIWNPDREFVLDLDSADVYRAADGDKSGEVAAYSGPPDRISDLEVDGSVTTISTPGGRCHLVRGMDPAANTAEANPPYLADDRDASLEADKIDQNRGTLTDLATIGRDLVASMSTFRVVSDANAVRDIDNSIRHALSAGGDSLEDVLADAVAGTRYEGTYQPDFDGEEPGSPESNPGGDGDKSDSSDADEMDNAPTDPAVTNGDDN